MKNPTNKDWKKASIEERFAEAERLRKEYYKDEYEKNPYIQKINSCF